MNDEEPLEREIFAGALELASAAEREVFLARACGPDAALRGRVEALLNAHAKADAFLLGQPRPDPVTVVCSAPLMEREGTLIGRYKLLEKLGEGGFGVVYVAEQREPVKRRVALKIIKLGMDTKQVVARFEAERQALALMDHPHIAHVLDAGATDTGRPYFVMELVRGVPLTKYCDDNNLPTRERLDLFIKVCHAIQHAHQKGVIHRDIKPSNILVTLHDGVPVPKVIDFGIAKATQGELTDKTVYTQFQQFIGTPAYMSPEQAEMSGLDVDTRSDIYSLGVLLYELLVGKTPFDGRELLVSGLDEMRRTLREKVPLKPSTRLRDMADVESSTTARRRGADLPRLLHLVRGDLDWIVMKCLEKDRTRRYDTANGLALDIQRHLANEPVTARPPSQIYRLQKMARRNRFTLAAAAAVAIILVAALGATTLGWRTARAERDKAIRARQEAEAARTGEQAQRQRAEQAREKEAEQRREAEAQRRLARLNAYAADMKAAQVALVQNSRGQAAQLLDRYRPAPGEEDLRGVEWRYLWQAVQGDEIHTWRHPSMVMAARFSPDGRVIVSDSFDGFLRVWDVASRRLLAKIERGAHGDYGNLSICFSPDGRTLASMHQQGIVLVDTATWRITRTLDELESDGPGAIASLAWSPDGQWLVARLRNAIQLLSPRGARGPVISRPYRGGRVAFGADGSLFAVSGETAEIWDSSTRKLLHAFPVLARTVALSPLGDRVACGLFNGEVQMRDLRTGQVDWTTPAHRSEVYGLTFSRDGQRLATGAFDQVIHVWDLARREKVRTLRGHHNEIWSLEFSPDDRHLLSASKDGTVKLWDLEASPPATRWWIDPTNSFLGFSPDRHGLITIATNGHALSHWEGPRIRKTVPLAELPGGDARVSVVLSPKGTSLVVVGTNGTLQTFSAETGRPIRPAVKLTGEVSHPPYRLSANERWVAGSYEGTNDNWGVALWDAATGNLAARFPRVFGPAFSSDESSLALGTPENAVQVWSLTTTNLAHSLTNHTWFIQSVAFSADGKQIATSAAEGEVRVWELGSGLQIGLPLSGHGSGIASVGFSSEGKTLFTAGYDNTVRFWHLPTGREMLLFDRARDNRLGAVDYSIGVWSPSDSLLALWDFERAALRIETIPTWAEIEQAEQRRQQSQFTSSD